jgi:large subunit ribosomal protein L21
MYAIVETGGKQYRLEEAAVIDVEKMDGDVGDAVALERVLLVRSDGQVKIGHPVVEGALVRCRIVGQVKGPKVRVFTYKAKDNVRRRKGHRQQYSRLLVEKIEA